MLLLLLKMLLLLLHSVISVRGEGLLLGLAMQAGGAEGAVAQVHVVGDGAAAVPGVDGLLGLLGLLGPGTGRGARVGPGRVGVFELLGLLGLGLGVLLLLVEDVVVGGCRGEVVVGESGVGSGDGSALLLGGGGSSGCGDGGAVVEMVAGEVLERVEAVDGEMRAGGFVYAGGPGAAGVVRGGSEVKGAVWG